ncbi:MAG TPA: hypothetical protein QGF58_02990 [Myxococcota bacterium]|nr:hypothetical protein [Myxococcota bacterium]
MESVPDSGDSSTGDLFVHCGSLTIEPGAVVRVEEGAGFVIGADDYEASLLAEGTVDSPIRFHNGKTLSFGKNGAAGLVAQGTEAAPITFTSQESNAAGAWDGVIFYGNVEDEQVILEHVVVENGGAGALDGALHFKDAGGSLDNVEITNSETWGLYIEGDSSPTLGEITGEGNAEGLIYQE